MPQFYKMPSGRMRFKRNGGSRRGFKDFQRGSAWIQRHGRMLRSRRPRIIRKGMNLRTGGYLGTELKFYDQKLIGTTLATSTDGTGGELDPSSVILMNTVTQGDGESQRDGRKITMRSIYVSGHVSIPIQASQSTFDNMCFVFLALVLDTQTNAATINSEDVYINPGGNAVTAVTPQRNLENIQRFKVLGIRKMVFSSPSATNDTGATGGVILGGLGRFFQFSNKLGIDVHYKGTTENVGNITDNSLHLIGWCSDTGMAPNISYVSRLRFTG